MERSDVKDWSPPPNFAVTGIGSYRPDRAKCECRLKKDSNGDRRDSPLLVRESEGNPGGKWILNEEGASSDNQPGVGR